MNTRLRKELRLLRLYVILSAPVLVILLFSAFVTKADPARFEEISAERINIVETDGSLRMTIANRERSPDPIVDGKTIRAQGGGRPGMIFYNDEGDETGGLVFATSGKAWEEGYAYSQLSLDRFKQDQVAALRYIENDGRWFAGLQVWDRPSTSLGEEIEGLERLREMPDGPAKEALRDSLMVGDHQRLFVGRTRSGASMVSLRDSDGKVRIRMQVDSLGTPTLEFFDESGNVTYSLPEPTR